MSLLASISSFWCAFQEQLFPTIEEDLGPLGERYESFITVLEFVRVEQHLPCFRNLSGRPRRDRAALARAFIAKAVFQIDTTRALLERQQFSVSERGIDAVQVISERENEGVSCKSLPYKELQD